MIDPFINLITLRLIRLEIDAFKISRVITIHRKSFVITTKLEDLHVNIGAIEAVDVYQDRKRVGIIVLVV